MTANIVTFSPETEEKDAHPPPSTAVDSATAVEKEEEEEEDGAEESPPSSPLSLSSPSPSPSPPTSPSLATSSSPLLRHQKQQQNREMKGKGSLFPRNESLPYGLAASFEESPPNFLINQESEEWVEHARRAVEESIIRRYQQQRVVREDEPFSLADVLPEIREGMEAIVNDSFSACFERKPPEAWNWNPFLFVVWCIGLAFRYGVVLPVRFAFFMMGMMTFMFIFFVLYLMKESPRKKRLFHRAIQYFAGVWIISICGVIKYHDIPPVRRKNQIYASNHTSLLDYIVLGHYMPFAAVGQKHSGFVGFLQSKVVAPLNNIFFERFEYRDRRLVTQRMKDHISDTSNPPLLIFPEGVCVNNEYSVLFKKGIFEIEDVEICPVAIRYNKLFSDPYWSSKHESFFRHILRIMRSWCLVCDVYFLEPQKRLPGESAEKFAGRVQKLIANRAGLTSLDWDGYYKYFQVSERLIKERQKQTATKLRAKFNMLTSSEETPDNTYANSTGDSTHVTPADGETKKER